jgi:hypothetical protein
VGTIFCENVDRPNIFEEVENDQVTALLEYLRWRLYFQISSISRKSNEKYVKQVPLVYLEDESGRIELDLCVHASYDWVTGITLGLRGVADAKGKFKISKIVEAGIPALPVRKNIESDSYVALVSGLHYGSTEGSISSARSLLTEFLNGDIFVRFIFILITLTFHRILARNISKYLQASFAW